MKNEFNLPPSFSAGRGSRARPSLDGVATSGSSRRGAASRRCASALLYFSNGVDPKNWWAKGAGDALEFGPAAAPLTPIKKDVLFLKGLYNHQAFTHTSPHMGRMANMLSGARISSDPADIRCGTTMDQVLAKQIGGATQVPSMALGIEPNELRLEDGLSMIYGSNLSWVSPSQACHEGDLPGAHVRPAGRRRQGPASSTRASWTRCSRTRTGSSRRSAATDRKKLDEYLESVRDIEKRIERAGKEERLEGWRPTLAKPNMPRPADEIPQNVPDHMKLMMDLVVLAFQMDKTRIATLMLNNDLSQMNFKFIDGVRGALHLDLTHNGKSPELQQMYLKTNQFHMQQFAYVVQKMKAVDEGGSSLLDNSIMMLASNLYDGDAHGADQMPIYPGEAAGSCRAAARWTCSKRGTRTAGRARCTCRSWTGWA